MWNDWQNCVKSALPLFCKHPIYVTQDFSPQQYELAAEYVARECPVIVAGKTLGQEYGASIINTKAQGPLTRMWLDSMCETNFIARHLALNDLDILDIGAGYGRLAAAMSPLVKSYTCTDAVPISIFVCEYFTMKHAPAVQVMTPEQVVSGVKKFNLAINVHSWNECSIESVLEWLEIIKMLKIGHLFIVLHNTEYNAWSGGSFRPYLERDFTLVDEQLFGLHQANTPPFIHALWKLK